MGKCFDVPTKHAFLGDLVAKRRESRVHQLYLITFRKGSHVPMQSCPENNLGYQMNITDIQSRNSLGT